MMRRAFTVGVLVGALLFIALTLYTPLTPIHVVDVHAASVAQTNYCSDTAGATSFSCSFSSSVTKGDLLVVSVGLLGSSINSSQISVTDSLSDSFTGVAYSEVFDSSSAYYATTEIFYATASSTGSDKITVNLGVAQQWFDVFIVDAQGYGASNVVTSTGTGSGTVAYVTSFSPSAGSLVVGGITETYSIPNSCTPPSGFSCTYFEVSMDEYDASYGGGSTTLTTSWTNGVSGTPYWSMSAAAFPAAVTQPVVFSVAPSGQPADTISLSGCSVSPTSIPTSDNGVTVDLTAQPSCTITATLSSSSTANTRYVFSGGGTSVSIATCASGTCTTYSATYYYQDAESFAYSVSGGGTGYTAPTLSYTQYGGAASATLSTTATTYWLDAGSSWSVTNPLGGSTSTERWQANANTAGTASAGASVTITYYNQYAFTVSYSVADGGTGYSAPTFSYTQFGSAATYTATTTATTVWVDAGSSWSITNPLTGSSTSERWYTAATTSGTASAATTVNPTYYNQYYITTSYSVSGGGTGYSAPVLTYYYLGTQTTYTETTTATSFWVDAGTTWSITNPLSGSSSTEQWYTPTASGTISGAVTLSFTYYNQYLETLEYTVSGGGSPVAPTVTYTSLGSSASATASISGSTSPTTVWVDAGTTVTYPSSINTNPPTSGESWNTPTASFTASSSTTFNPTYYFEFVVTLAYSVVDGGTGYSAPVLTCNYEGSSHQYTATTTASSVYCDSGSSWSLTNPLTGSSTSERWYTNVATSGTVSGAFTLEPTYYNQYNVSVSYSVVDGGTGYSAPTLTYYSLGAQTTLTLSTTATSIWMDANTWSVTNPLTGSSSTERWYTPAATSGSVSSTAAIAPTYYNQYAFNVSYSVADGGTGYSAPTFSYTQFGSAATYTATTTATTVWVDAGTTWSLTNPLTGSSTSERWYTNAATSGTVSGAAAVNPTYYNQYYITTSYSVVDGGTGYSAPTLTYYSLGAQTTYTESTTASSFWADANTWSITNPLGGSTSSERWYTNAATSGTISGAVTLSFAYYNQYAFTVSYTVVDGGTGYTAPTLSGTQFGAAYTVTLSSTSTQTVWLDAGSSWSITNPLSGSSSTERWYTPAATSGSVSAATTLNPSYYNQYYVTFQLSYANSVSGLALSAPTVGATQFGAAYTVTVPTSGSVSAWLDATTGWTLNTLVIYQNTAGTQRVATTSQSGSVTASTTVTFTYYDQFLVNVVGLNTQYTEFGTTYTGTTSLTNQWVDAGSLLYTSGDYSYQWPVTMALYVYQASSGMQLAVNVSASNLAWNPSTYTLTWTAPTSYDQVYVPSSLGFTPASVTDNGVSITFKWTGTLLTFSGSSNFVVTFSASVVNTGSTQASYTGVGQSTTSYTFVTGGCSPQNLPPSPLGMMEQGCFAPAIIDVYATTIGVPILFIVLELLFGSMVFIKTQNPVAAALVALLVAIVFPFMFPSSVIESVIVIGVAAFASAIYFAFNRQE